MSSLLDTARNQLIAAREQTEVHPVEPDLEAALVRLALHGLPEPPSRLELHNVRWDGQQAPDVTHMMVDCHGVVSIEGTPPSRGAVVEDPQSWRPSVFLAAVPPFGELVIEYGGSTVTRRTFGVDRSTVTASIQGWTWTIGRASAGLWVAPLNFAASRLPVLFDLARGNMLLRAEDGSARGWRFQTPDGPVFLTLHDGVWRIAVPTTADGNPPTTDRLALILGAVGFVVGEKLSVGLFQAMDSNGAVRALARLNLSGHSGHNAESQAPCLPWGVSPTWVARFVDRILQFAHDRPDSPLLLAFSLYFAGLDGLVQSSFLHTWIAGETLAKWAIRERVLGDGGERRIADHDKWMAWVSARENEIRAHASPGFEDALVSRVRSSEADRQSPVQRIFRGEALSWSDAMADAERVRNGVAHEGVMPAPDGFDWSRDGGRIGLARTMLTALVARLVSYDGPIADRSKTIFSIAGRDEPPWWPASPLQREVAYHGVGVDEVIAATRARIALLESSDT
jgi:hypothetical protein